jgi:hypothetical protein
LRPLRLAAELPEGDELEVLLLIGDRFVSPGNSAAALTRHYTDAMPEMIASARHSGMANK